MDIFDETPSLAASYSLDFLSSPFFPPELSLDSLSEASRASKQFYLSRLKGIFMPPIFFPNVF